MQALCAVCIADHASHDFIVADYKAANIVKLKLTGCLGSLDALIEEYSILLKQTSQKLAVIDDDQKS